MSWKSNRLLKILFIFLCLGGISGIVLYSSQILDKASFIYEAMVKQIMTSVTVVGGIDLYEMGTEPVMVFPRITLTGAISPYEVEFPADTIIPLGGQVVLAYPFGFSFDNSCSTALTSIENNDLNGPSTGVVTISSIVCDSTAHTITVTTGGAATQSGDRVRFLLQGIVNSATAMDFNTNGYVVFINTKDSSGSLLELKASMPFFLIEAGSQSISGTIFNDSVSGNPGIANIRICIGGAMGFQCSITDATGVYSFTQLSDGFYNIDIPPLTSGNFIGGPFFRDINLTGGQNETGVDFAFRSSDRTITVNIAGIPSNTDLDVFAFNPFDFESGGQIVREVLWSGSTDRSVSVPVSDGVWEIGLGPWMPKDPSLGLPPVPDFTFMPPRPQQVKVSGAGTYTIDFTIQTADRTINGSVVDGSGTAIPNVFVMARPAEFTSEIGGGGIAQSKNDGTFILNVVNGVYMIDASVLGMPSSSGLEVTVQDDGVYSKGILITNDGDGGSDNLILKIAKGDKSISGRVLDESGNTIAYAYVSAEKVDTGNNPIGAYVDSPTDASGNFTLYVSDGLWKLRGFAPGYGELESIIVSISGSSVTDQNLQAASADFGTVEGQVTQGGNSVSGAFIGIHGSSGGNSVVTDGSGNYSVKVKAGSNYTIEGFLPGSGPLSVITNVTVTANAVLGNQDLTIGIPGTIRVTITGVTDAFVDAFDSDGRGNGTGSNPTSGVYDISVPPSTYTVTANHPKYGPLGYQTGAVVTAGNITSVTFTPPTTYTVSGTISSDSSTCANGASIFLSDTTNGRVIVTTADSSGAYSTALPDGTYLLGAGKPGCIDSAQPTTITVSGANIASGTNRTLTIADVAVSGQVTLSGSNITVETKIMAESSDGRFVFVDVDTTNTSGNNYTLNLIAGTWTIRARSDGYASTESSLTVASGDSKTVNLSLSAISGYIRQDRMSALITPSRGGIVTDNNIGAGFEVNIPAGALGNSSDSGSVSTKQTTAIATETPTAKVVGGKGVEIIPKNASGQPITTLSSSSGAGVTITIPYVESDVTALGGDESNLVLAIWSEEKQQWDPLATTVDTTNNTVSAITTHFSIFAQIVPVGGGAAEPEPEPEPEAEPTPTAGGGGGGGGGGAAPTPVKKAAEGAPVSINGTVMISPILGGSTIRTNIDGSNAEIIFPPNAVSVPTDVNLISIAKRTVISTHPVLANVNIIGNWVYSFLAQTNGQTVFRFLKPITLTFFYTNAQAVGLNENSIRIYYWNNTTKQWSAIPGSVVNTFTNTVTVDINHLTLFTIMGSPIPAEGRPADLNGDVRVDLVDFSILLYNWGKPKNLKADINNDGLVDLVDFSIMLYWWTG